MAVRRRVRSAAVRCRASHALRPRRAPTLAPRIVMASGRRDHRITRPAGGAGPGVSARRSFCSCSSIWCCGPPDAAHLARTGCSCASTRWRAGRHAGRAPLAGGHGPGPADPALTLVVGRAWCGWICPLGTLLDLLPASRQRTDRRWLAPVARAQARPARGGGGAAWQSDHPDGARPLTLLTRAMASFILPLTDACFTRSSWP